MPKPTIEVTVKSHSDRRHIEDVSVLFHTDDVVILHVNLRTKYKEADAFGGATDPGVQSVWFDNDEIQIKGLPEKNITVSSTSRYEAFITIFRQLLVDEMCDNEGSILWQS